MLCKWNGQGLMGTPLIDPNAVSRGGEKMVMFMPGWNEVPDNQFNMIAVSLQDLVDNGRLELYDCKEVKETDAEGKPVENGKLVFVGKEFRDVRNDVARKMILEVFDFKLLQKWLDDPKVDRDIKYNIEKQLEACIKGEAPMVIGKKKE